MRTAVLLAGLALSACATPPPPAAGRIAPRPEAGAAPVPALRNAGFESPARPGARCPADWSCSAHNTPESFRFRIDSDRPGEGRQSVSISREILEPWALLLQSVPANSVSGRRIRLTISVRHEGEGGAIGPFIKAQDGAGVVIGHGQQMHAGPTPWRRIALEYDVPARVAILEVGALREGAGVSWVDDAVLEVVDPTSR